MAQIRRAKSWISARAQRTLAKELTGLIEIAATRIAPENADLGFDLLWSLLQLGPYIRKRLLAARRAEDALRIMETCIAADNGKDRSFDTLEVDSAHFVCLEALDKEDDLRRAMWTRFETRLCAEILRRYLSRLFDFDDDEALLEARAQPRFGRGRTKGAEAGGLGGVAGCSRSG